MFFGHLTEIIALVFLGLLVFGPKKMIDMASSLGRAVREFREATKDLSWQELTGMGSTTETPRETAMSKLSQFSQALGVAATQQTPTTTTTPTPSASAGVVDATVGPSPAAALDPAEQSAVEITNAPSEHEPTAVAPPSVDGQPLAKPPD